MTHRAGSSQGTGSPQSPNSPQSPDSPHHPTRTFPGFRSRREAQRIGELLRRETVGGGLLIALAVLALLWANSPLADTYFALRDLEVGYEPLGLRLSIGTWASDGLLAIFFFLIGLELKRELVTGALRRFSAAIVPVAAAAGGVAVPAVVYLAITWPDDALHRGWAIPTATDIAFAVAVLAVIGSHLPGRLRIFLLTLAVVDDLIAIGIIAIAYSDGIRFELLACSLAVIGVYAVVAARCRRLLERRPLTAWLLLLPLGMLAWVLLHSSGIHATIAGALLGLAVPMLHRRQDRVEDAGPGLAEILEHRFRPLSSGFAVPVFAFFAAGVRVGGGDGLVAALQDPLTIGILLALVVGKPVGIVGTTWLLTTVTRIRLDPALRWVDILGVGILGGIGFTVSLLIAELAFAPGTAQGDHAKLAVLVAGLVSTGAAAVLLALRNRAYRRLAVLESVDADGDGIPDVYQSDDGVPDAGPRRPTNPDTDSGATA